MFSPWLSPPADWGTGHCMDLQVRTLLWRRNVARP